MTGLSPPPLGTDTILSLSCILTTSRLQPLDPAGYNVTIHHSASTLSAMSPWCISTHTASGLVDACIASSVNAETAAAELLEYIKKYIPEGGKALLAGNSIHADRSFLMQKPWTEVLAWLHYRVLDVSSVKECVRRWCGEDVLRGVPRKEGRHEARADVEESIEEARYYMRILGVLKIGEV